MQLDSDKTRYTDEDYVRDCAACEEVRKRKPWIGRAEDAIAEAMDALKEGRLDLSAGDYSAIFSGLRSALEDLDLAVDRMAGLSCSGEALAGRIYQ